MHHPPSPPADPTDPHEAEAIEWLRNVYQGDTMRQLSVRSVVTGMLIGGVMSVSNLYVGLKTGWSLGVTITACIIAYAVFRFLEQVVPRWRNDPFTILENYTMSSAASAAGYMSSAGLVSAIPALYLTEKITLPGWQIMCWLAAVSLLGVFMAIPLKRQLIDVDKLPFPSGIATAETLKSMHTSGAQAVRKATALAWGAVVGAVIPLWKDALPLYGNWLAKKIGSPAIGDAVSRVAFPESIPLFPGGQPLVEKLTLGFEGSSIMVAAGAIMGIRVGLSLLLGAVFFYGICGPILIEQQITDPGYGRHGINSWTLWPATAMMVTSGLLAFGMRWRTVLRSFRGISTIVTGRTSTDALAKIDVPGSWFVLGTTASGLACVVFGAWFFGISWWMGLLAVAVSFLLSIVAARATGETDVTPIGAMGKITQLMFGAVAPSNVQINLMTAGITAGAASHSADLLQDLKSGYLLGGNPRQQTISQLFGVLAGTLMCVPVYMLIVKPEQLGGSEMPAPAAKVWAGVAEVLKGGFDQLPAGAKSAILWGGLAGIVLTLLEEFLPKHYRRFLPSATGLSIAGVVPAFNSISMFLGALIAWLLSKFSPKINEEYTIAVSSGLIAGESLMGVAVIMFVNGPAMVAEFWSYLRPLFE